MSSQAAQLLSPLLDRTSLLIQVTATILTPAFCRRKCNLPQKVPCSFLQRNSLAPCRHWGCSLSTVHLLQGNSSGQFQELTGRRWRQQGTRGAAGQGLGGGVPETDGNPQLSRAKHRALWTEWALMRARGSGSHMWPVFLLWEHRHAGDLPTLHSARDPHPARPTRVPAPCSGC